MQSASVVHGAPGQSRVPPQPSEIVPPDAPWAAHVVGVQPQTFGVPPPPHVFGAVQVPQLNVPPQPSGTEPQLFPAGHVVIGVQPQTFGVPPPPQLLGDVQDPQSRILGHVPLGIVPQLAPRLAQVVGVQHVVNGLEPGGAPLRQALPQQARLVAQGAPSGLQLWARAARGPMASAARSARANTAVTRTIFIAILPPLCAAGSIHLA